MARRTPDERGLEETDDDRATNWEIVQSLMTESEQLLMIHVLSGRRVYIPKRFDLTQENVESLVAAIGESAARKLCASAGGAVIDVPSANFLQTKRRHMLIRRAVMEGARPATIADLLGLSDRQVRRVIRGL